MGFFSGQNAIAKSRVFWNFCGQDFFQFAISKSQTIALQDFFGIFPDFLKNPMGQEFLYGMVNPNKSHPCFHASKNVENAWH